MQHYSFKEAELARLYGEWEEVFMYLEAMKPIRDFSVLRECK